jgi:uncharacterized membrane protein
VIDIAPAAGRFHPFIVHLPIGFLLLAGVLEALARTRRFAAVRAAVGPALVCGAASAALAAATGTMLGASGGYAGDTFVWHQRAGIGVAGAATFAALAYFRTSLSRSWRLIYSVLLAMTLLLVVAAGHLGGTLTHGEGYLTEHLLPLIGHPAGAEAGDRPPPGQAVIYTSLVRPLLDARCVSCHGANKAEGRLRLDSPEGLRAGGDSGAALAPGRPDDSEIVRRTWLPPTHEDAMPPDGHRPLTASEAALLRWWVEQGASFDQIVVDAEMPAHLQPVVESVLGPIEPGTPAILSVRVPPAEPSAIAALERLGARVKPIGSATALLDVECSGAGAAFGDAQLPAIAAIAPQVTWLGLAGTAVTDGSLATVGRLPHLTRLRLERTRVTDAGLPHLAALQRLEYLNLYATGVTDAGLQSLEPLASLRHLYLWQTGVTVAGVERLRAALPRLTIETGHSNYSNSSNDSN